MIKVESKQKQKQAVYDLSTRFPSFISPSPALRLACFSPLLTSPLHVLSSSAVVERLIRIRRRWGRSLICFRQRAEEKKKANVEEKKKKKKEGRMEWLKKILFPMRRVLLGIAGRVRARRRGRGLLKLYNDVQSCGYQDVQVMWEMLQNSEICSSPKKQRSTWRICIWAAHPR